MHGSKAVSLLKDLVHAWSTDNNYVLLLQISRVYLVPTRVRIVFSVLKINLLCTSSYSNNKDISDLNFT